MDTDQQVIGCILIAHRSIPAYLLSLIVLVIVNETAVQMKQVCTYL